MNKGRDESSYMVVDVSERRQSWNRNNVLNACCNAVITEAEYCTENCSVYKIYTLE